MTNVKEVMLALEGFQALDVEQTRVLFVNCAEEMLKRYNQSEKIRPYLDHYPFDENDIELSISFNKKSGQEISNEYVAHVFLVNGNVCYSYYDFDKKRLERRHKEPYQEALKKVKEAGLLVLSDE